MVWHSPPEGLRCLAWPVPPAPPLSVVETLTLVAQTLDHLLRQLPLRKKTHALLYFCINKRYWRVKRMKTVVVKWLGNALWSVKWLPDTVETSVMKYLSPKISLLNHFTSIEVINIWRTAIHKILSQHSLTGMILKGISTHLVRKGCNQYCCQSSACPHWFHSPPWVALVLLSWLWEVHYGPAPKVRRWKPSQENTSLRKKRHKIWVANTSTTTDGTD